VLIGTGKVALSFTKVGDPWWTWYIQGLFSPYHCIHCTLIIAFTTNLTFKILHSYLSQCTCKTMNRFSTTASSKPKKEFQNHAQAERCIRSIGRFPNNFYL